MKKFAKLFETKEVGQVLVTLETGESGPEIKTSIMLDEFGLGVCSVSMSSSQDSDEAWNAYEKIFEEITEAQSIERALVLKNNIEGAMKKEAAKIPVQGL